MPNDNFDALAGIIPATGFITIFELFHRLQLRDHRALQDDLAELGVPHVALAGKRLYRCEDLNQLFEVSLERV